MVAPPGGARIRTRLSPSLVEAVALREIGTFLGGLVRVDLTTRLGMGRVPVTQADRAGRKRALTAVSSSRWAGAITRTVEDQVKLSTRALRADVSSLRAAIRTLSARIDAPVGRTAGTGRGRVRGYRSRGERWSKLQRRQVLVARLGAAQARLAAGRPSIVLGGRGLLTARLNLADAGLTVDEWRARWDASRLFLTADGETGMIGGNSTIRVTEDGRLAIRVPTALIPKHGRYLTLRAPVVFPYRGEEWLDRVSQRRCVRYDVSYDPARDRWYLDASWGVKDVPAPSVAALTEHRSLAVDLNADHLAAWVVDRSGNPCGSPITVPVVLVGPASQRDGRLRAAISELLQHATRAGCAAIVIEDLNFTDARTTGRETMGRGARGKTFRRVVAGIPTARFRERLTSMAANAGLWVIAVDPAYTSRWGGQHWQRPLDQRTPGTTVTRHLAAAVVIGRRAHGCGARRTVTRPGTPERGRPRVGPVDPHPGTCHPAANRTRQRVHHGAEHPEPPHPQPAHAGTQTGQGHPGDHRHAPPLPTPFGEHTARDSLPLSR